MCHSEKLHPKQYKRNSICNPYIHIEINVHVIFSEINFIKGIKIKAPLLKLAHSHGLVIFKQSVNTFATGR